MTPSQQGRTGAKMVARRRKVASYHVITQKHPVPGRGCGEVHNWSTSDDLTVRPTMVPVTRVCRARRTASLEVSYARREW